MNVKPCLLGRKVTVCKKSFNSFEVPLELNMLTQVGVENEGFVSQDISKTFLVSHFSVKDIHFSKTYPECHGDSL